MLHTAPSRGASCSLDQIAAGTSHGRDRAADGGCGQPQGGVAHPQDDHADRQESDARVSAGRSRSSRTNTATRPRCSPTASASATASSPRAPTATRAGRWRKASRKGDTVCLLMPNRPEFLAIWLGITRVGGVVALLNTNLTGTALAHCINVVESEAHHRGRGIVRIAGERARRTSPATRKIWLHGDADANFARIDREIDGLSGADARRRPSSPRADHRGPRALHLHLGHHRPAQGGQHQPLPA